VTTLPPQAERVSLIGLNYARLKGHDGSDLYVTPYGLPFLEHLLPDNWYAPDWFEAKRVRLVGTSAIYRVPTKSVRGTSLDLVARFSRVGQDIPLDPRAHNENPQAEFNSPFEEFSLVMELRASRVKGPQPCILTKRPLAIHVPAQELQDWQTGRSESNLLVKELRHPEARIEMRRQYILLYGWINGLNAVQASQALGMLHSAAEKFKQEATLRASRDLEVRGFRMVDLKPEHVVLRIRPDGSLLCWRDGTPVYALVDYELLERL
jgi:hypothetical protein